jgi:hypothetical protein
MCTHLSSFQPTSRARPPPPGPPVHLKMCVEKVRNTVKTTGQSVRCSSRDSIQMPFGYVVVVKVAVLYFVHRRFRDACCYHDGHGGRKLLWNVGEQSIRQPSSDSPPWEHVISRCRSVFCYYWTGALYELFSIQVAVSYCCKRRARRCRVVE